MVNRAAATRTDMLRRLEEAVHLLTRAPLRAWLWYAIGVVPFMIEVLRFSVNMWESPFAARALGPAALPVALAYVWLKYGQTRFVRELYAVIHPQETSSHDSVPRVLMRQTLWQPFSLFFVPLSHLSIFLYPLVSAFWQHLTVGEAMGPSENESVTRRALTHAGTQVREVYLYTLIAKNALIFLAFFNWLTILGFLPQLLFMLTGIENEFVRSPWTYLHVSFILTVLLFTHFTVDPINKAFFLLRSYSAASRANGADLRDRVRHLSAARHSTALGVGLLLFLGILGAAPPVLAHNAETLDQTLNEVSMQRKFVWRMPPEVLENSERTLSAWQRWVDTHVRGFFGWLGDRWDDFIDWWERFFRKSPPPPGDFSFFSGMESVAKGILVFLAVALLLLVVFLFVRARRRHRAALADTSPAVPTTPDLTREDVTAGDLPTDEWLALVNDLRARGEWRLALRALFLAFLARLGDNHLIVVARHKSNRDYERELARRAHTVEGLLPCYRDFRRHFESVWYGDRPASEELLGEQLERIRVLEGLA